MKNKNTPLDSIKRKSAAYGFTNFIDAVDRHLKTLEPESYEHAILTYLRKHGVGAANAKNWKMIHSHLKSLGITISKQKFQTKLLQDSRKDLYFIGSSNPGYFLLEMETDVEIACQFYQSRIAKETQHLGGLNYLSSKADFKAVNP